MAPKEAERHTSLWLLPTVFEKVAKSLYLHARPSLPIMWCVPFERARCLHSDTSIEKQMSFSLMMSMNFQKKRPRKKNFSILLTRFIPRQSKSSSHPISRHKTSLQSSH